LAELHPPALARHRPDPIQPGQSLEQRRNFRRHQQMQVALGKMRAQGAERRRKQHGVTEVFELQGKDFQSRTQTLKRKTLKR
jgi:hypothetical protein